MKNKGYTLVELVFGLALVVVGVLGVAGVVALIWIGVHFLMKVW